LSPPTRRDLRRAARWSSIRKILSRIAKFADVRADRGSLQVQRFGYLPFWAPLPPKPYKQSVALQDEKEAGEPFLWRALGIAYNLARVPVDALGELIDRGAQRMHEPQGLGQAQFVGAVTFEV